MNTDVIELCDRPAILRGARQRSASGCCSPALKKQVLEVFQRPGLYDQIGAGRFFRTEDQALDRVWKQNGNNHAADCPLNIVCQIKPAG